MTQLQTWLTWIGWIVGFIGLPLSIYFYIKSKYERKPLFYLSRDRIPVVSSKFLGTAPIKVVDKNGEQVTEDLTVLYLFFWNQGKKAIRKEHIFEPISIYIGEEPATFLGARIAKTTSDDITIEALTTYPTKSFQIHFRLLNPQDGALIQIFLKGNKDAKVNVSGKIEEVPASNINQEIRTFQSDATKELLWLAMYNLMLLLFIAALHFIGNLKNLSTILLIGWGLATMTATLGRWLPFPGKVRIPKTLR